ncbi:hypothetical protein Trydic_g14198 [Trypoxylus dichotomus]
MKAKWLPYIIFLNLSIAFGSEILRSNDKFAKKLYNVLDTKDKNIIFSPLNLHTILSIIYTGSVGKTTSVLERTLGLPAKKYVPNQYKNALNVLLNEEKARNVTLRIANKIYLAKGFQLNNDFKRTVNKDFLAEISTLDLSNSIKTAIKIDRWVQNRTDNKIKRLIDSSSLKKNENKAVHLLLAVSAIYFKGNWVPENAFNPSKTKRMPFYQNSSRTVHCQMMSRKGKFLHWASGSMDADFLKLDYDDGRYSMVIALPQRRDGIDELEAKLAGRDLSILINRFFPTVMNLQIPKFKLEATLDPKLPLRQMGLGRIFANDANFSEMIRNNGRRLKVTDVKQKVVLEMDEGNDTNGPPNSNIESYMPPATLIADHPFIVFITAKLDIQEDCLHWDTVLLMGKVSSPEEA